MAPRRSKGRASTPALLIWATVILLFGFGVGTLLTLSCNRRSKPPVEKQTPPPKSPTHGPGKSERKPAKDLRPAPPDKAQPALPPQEPSTPSTPARPKFAIVIDDLGYVPTEMVIRLCAQDVPLSVAILPFQPYTQESARIAHERGKEILLHLPMEPQGYPGPSRDPGPGAVMYDLSEQEIRARVRKALLDVPYRRGVNNHMGSRITPDSVRMTWILQELKKTGCYFVDSRTEKDSVAYALAAQLGIPSVQRKVFLDDSKDFQEMEKQWERALGIARKDGSVLIIGHIYPETLAALEKLIPRTRSEVDFVTARALAE